MTIFRITMLLTLGFPLVAAVRSVYTPLSGPKCSLVKEDKETGSTIHACPGPSTDIGTKVLYDDQRMSLSLSYPADQRDAALDLWTVVTKSFSSLGSKAEWRIDARTGSAIALIVRVNATGADGNRTSMLAVAKVNQQEACVVAVIPAAHTAANIRARELADDSAAKPCLQGEKQ